MAWVRPKNPKPKQKDPMEVAESMRPILQFFSAGHTPKQGSRPRLPQQQLQVYDDYHEERRPRRQPEIEEYLPEYRADEHAFSFSRDRLIPIAPKPSSRKTPSHNRPIQQAQTVERPMTHRTRSISTPSPPPSVPPLSFKARVEAKHRAPSVCHHVTADPPRAVSSRWMSATTPLEL